MYESMTIKFQAGETLLMCRGLQYKVVGSKVYALVDVSQGMWEEIKLSDMLYRIQQDLRSEIDWGLREAMPTLKWVSKLQTIWEGNIYGRFWVDNDVIHLSTGGWSENEEKIWELKQSIFWAWGWLETSRGGLYKFQMPKE